MPSSRESRISALPSHLQELLRRRLSGQEERTDRILLADRSVPVPLSFSQQRLWFLDEFAPGGTEYNSAQALRLVGTLDVAALTRALQELSARHESLRTTFDQVDGKGVQIVHPAGEFLVPMVDLTGPSGSGPDELERVLSDEYSRPFDLRRGTLFRALLVRLGASEYVLMLTAHHIITDGWSMGVLLRGGGCVVQRCGAWPGSSLADFRLYRLIDSDWADWRIVERWRRCEYGSTSTAG